VKEVAVRLRIGGRTITIGGMAKGSGMIHPDMATMLAFLTTDAAIAQPALQQALREAADRSFNCISVDGDTSTNDTVLCLANGLARNAAIERGSRAYDRFLASLIEACTSLAMQICRDGEGVTKVVHIHVTGARSASDAKRIARTIATSCLVKTALFGEDANWGRIMAAVGRASVRINQQKIGLAFDGIPIVRNGMTLGAAAERRIARVVRRREFTIAVSLGLGAASARVWTTDLSYDYVKINASYRT
jgi:glutamate N-acetyltransferase/amino-acid N-acetyltransferase